MSFPKLVKFFFTVLLLTVIFQPIVILAQNDSDIIPGKYIILLKQQESPSLVAQSFGFIRTQTYEHVFNGMTITATTDEIENLKSDPRIAAIEPDRIVRAFAQTIPTGVNRVEADTNPTSKIDGTDERVDVDIAILDTGISKTHPDLNLYKFVNFASGSTNDDGHGHGTHVAGIAAALDNDIGYVGMAPGARLWAVKVLGDSGQGSLSDIIKGIDYVTQHADEIEVANMSLGGEFTSAILDAAITNSVKAGVTYVVAAGNDGRNAATFSPANHFQVITVSAIADSDGKPGGEGAKTGHGNDDSFALFSNYGETIEIAAPGVDIFSSFKNAGYAKLSGTSMASPHVAGAAALYVVEHGRDLNKDGSINEDDVALIRQGVISLGVSQSDKNGFSGDPDAFAEPLLFAGPPMQESDFSLFIPQSSVRMNPNASNDTAVILHSLKDFTGTIILDAIPSSSAISTMISPDVISIGPSENKTAQLTIYSQNTIGTFGVTVTAKSSDGKITHTDNVSVEVTQNGGCLIATAAFGTELAPQVQLLREIRDNVLFSTDSGTVFMTSFNEFYYSFSPGVADLERQSPAFKETIRLIITPMLSTLSVLNYVDIDSEQEMLGYGIGIMLLNAGMYLIMPALLIFFIKKKIR